MQYVNDDMDELFREAAEKYPLDTSGADWDSVQKLMPADGSAAVIVPDKRANKKRYWLLLLLLIPAFWLPGKFIFEKSNPSHLAQGGKFLAAGENKLGNLPANNNKADQTNTNTVTAPCSCACACSCSEST